MTSSAATCARRIGISTAMPRRASLYARSPPIFTADVAGIGSSTSPRRRASRRSSSGSAGGSSCSRTSPSGSPVEVRAERSMSVTYRLSNPTKHGASLVVQPDNSTNNPVANGSSVPAWPVRAPVRRRSSATIANELGPAGLSARTMPAGLSARGGTRRRRVSGREFASHEGGDLLDRRLAGEARSLTVASAARLPRDRRDIELVDARAKRHAPRRPAVARRLADQHGEPSAFDRAEVVDDPLRVRLRRANLTEIRAHEKRDDHPPALVN